MHCSDRGLTIDAALQHFITGGNFPHGPATPFRGLHTLTDSGALNILKERMCDKCVCGGGQGGAEGKGEGAGGREERERKGEVYETISMGPGTPETMA